AGLLALAGVLGVGEGHLLHQVSRRLRLSILPNLEVFFRVSLGTVRNPEKTNSCLLRAEIL
ncbi:hypothetical protein, partial [Pseudomonas sp.]|uniref:hypothetical protein n=1 Tax=Pseudomonas sp. TaxID=306 RepID=UPI003D6FFBCC